MLIMPVKNTNLQRKKINNVDFTRLYWTNHLLPTLSDWVTLDSLAPPGFISSADT